MVHNHTLSMQLVKVYPLEICKLYWQECETLCSQSNKQNYMQAVSLLEEIQVILKSHGFLDEWVSEYASFIKRHKSKTLLLGFIKCSKELYKRF